MKGLIILFVIFTSIICTTTYASNSITYYYGESINISDEHIDILSNEVSIDINTSKVNNTVYIQNKSDSLKIINISIPIDNKKLDFSAHDVKIFVNNAEIDAKENELGEYTLQTKIAPDENKKIDISYITDNNLQKAKVIKYNMEKWKGKTIGKIKVDVIIDEANIPLIEKLYPGHFKFDKDNYIITVDYYNCEITTITKDIIIQKETFHNLLYGREKELSENQIKVIEEWRDGERDIEKLIGNRYNSVMTNGTICYIYDYLKKDFDPYSYGVDKGFCLSERL